MTAAPLPVNLLCGYLGSGKTTQLNTLLTQTQQRIAVMVNDFGAVQIDAELIAGATGDIIRLTNGCICCAMDGDLFRGFERIFALRDQIDRLVIEASGVAEPHRLTGIARAEPDLDCQRVITMVCAQTFLHRLRDPSTGPVLDAQVTDADAIIFSRRDIATPAQLEQVRLVVAALNADVPVLDALTDNALAGSHTPHPARRQPRAHFEQFGSTAIPLAAPQDRDAFERFFQSAPSVLHRAKGFVNFIGDARTHVFQFAAGVLTCTPHTAQEQGIAVLIGPGLRRDDFPDLG